ncbi:MAG: M23 family metallopeptidase [Bacteroidia bacterium]|nr:M23 family metallopeptidase [Bacteroidia bacterium]
MIRLWVWLQLSWPVPGPITLTGSYGEIRDQTFHTGIDLSVGEKIGVVPVLSAGEGYVYRIRVSHTGFGRVLYVRHPQGLLTVYGHLSHFAPKGERIVEELQQTQRRFEVESYLPPTAWPVKRGDTLGWAGNSGYSFGPHLHFEVRTLSERPVCPFRYLPPVGDSQPPVFFRIALQPLSPYSLVEEWGEKRRLRFRQVSCSRSHRRYICLDTPSVAGPIGIEYTAADRYGGGTAWLGLARISLRDSAGDLLYQARWESLDFDWRRFLRWHIDFAYQQLYRIGIARLYKPSHEKIPWNEGEGAIVLPPGRLAVYRIEAADFAGNTAEVLLVLRGKAPPSLPAPRRPLNPRLLWAVEEGFLLSREPLYTSQGDTITPYKPLRLGDKLPDTLWSRRGKALPTYLKACIPPGHAVRLSLSPNCTLSIQQETLQETLYCQVRPIQVPFGKGFFIGDEKIPIRFPAELQWAQEKGSAFESRSYPLFRPPRGGAWSPVIGAKREGLSWRIPVRSWGEYIMMVDSFPPHIRPLRAEGPYYLVLIEDLGSGVNPYQLQVRGEKGNLYPEYYEPQQILYLPRKAGKKFHILAVDRVGNRTEKEIRF